MVNGVMALFSAVLTGDFVYWRGFVKGVNGFARLRVHAEKFSAPFQTDEANRKFIYAGVEFIHSHH